MSLSQSTDIHLGNKEAHLPWEFVSLKFYKDYTSDHIIEIANKEYEDCVIAVDMHYEIYEKIIPPFSNGRVRMFNLPRGYIDLIMDCKFVEITLGVLGNTKYEINLGKYMYSLASDVIIKDHATILILKNYTYHLMESTKSNITSTNRRMTFYSELEKLFNNFIKPNTNGRIIIGPSNGSGISDRHGGYESRYLKTFFDKFAHEKFDDNFYIARDKIVIAKDLSLHTGMQEQIEYDENSYYKVLGNLLTLSEEVAGDLAAPVAKIYRVFADESFVVTINVGDKVSISTFSSDGNRAFVKGTVIGIKHLCDLTSKLFTTIYVLDAGIINHAYGMKIPLTEVLAEEYKTHNIFIEKYHNLAVSDLLRREREDLEEELGMLTGYLIESSNPVLHFSAGDQSEGVFGSYSLSEKELSSDKTKTVGALMASVWAGPGYGMIVPHYEGEYGLIMPVEGKFGTRAIGLYYWIDKPNWIPDYQQGDFLIHLRNHTGQLLFSQNGEFVIEATSIKIDASSAGGFSVRPNPEGTPGTITINGDVQIKLGDNATSNLALANHTHNHTGLCLNVGNPTTPCTSNTTKTVAE